MFWVQEEVFTLPSRFHMESIWNGVECPHSMDCSMDYFLAGSPALDAIFIHQSGILPNSLHTCIWAIPDHPKKTHIAMGAGAH